MKLAAASPRASHDASRRRVWWVLLIALALLSLPLACNRSAQRQATVVVASKNFPESALLGEIMAQLIEANTELQVDRKFDLKGTMICFDAMQAGEVDLYAEYTGTALLTILDEPVPEDPDSQAVYQRVAEQFAKKYNMQWLEPFGFNNYYALAMREGTEMRTISELAEVSSSYRGGFSHEFLNRPDGFPALSDRYGLELADIKGLDHGLAYQAISSGKIDVTDAYGTDGKRAKYNLVLLRDDKHFFPPYDAAPVVRRELAERHPQVVEALNELGGVIEQQQMISLNYQIEVKKRSKAEVAREFLKEEGLIDVAYDAPFIARMSWGKLGRLTLEHLRLTLTATGMAALIGVVLGVLVAQYPRVLSGPVLGAAGVVQTIPSLALLCFMIPVPFLGIGVPAAIAALFLYALLPIVRNTYTGIAGVSYDLKEAGQAMGMTRAQRLLWLELPLATKTIMAGVRTTLVINIGTATIAAFIGAGGLGEPIVTGLSMNDTELIMWGAVPAALLALICDLLMSLLERAIEPKGLKVRQ